MQVVRQASGLLGPAGQIGQCEWAERAAQVHGGRQEYMGGREPGAGSARGPAAPPATKACLLGSATVALRRPSCNFRGSLEVSGSLGCCFHTKGVLFRTKTATRAATDLDAATDLEQIVG